MARFCFLVVSVVALLPMAGRVVTASEPERNDSYGLEAKIVKIVTHKERSTIQVDCMIRNTKNHPVLMQEGAPPAVMVLLRGIADDDEETVEATYLFSLDGTITLRQYIHFGAAKQWDDWTIVSLHIPEEKIADLIAAHVQSGKPSWLTIEFDRDLILP